MEATGFAKLSEGDPVYFWRDAWSSEGSSHPAQWFSGRLIKAGDADASSGCLVQCLGDYDTHHTERSVPRYLIIRRFRETLEEHIGGTATTVQEVDEEEETTALDHSELDDLDPSPQPNTDVSDDDLDLLLASSDEEGTARWLSDVLEEGRRESLEELLSQESAPLEPRKSNPAPNTLNPNARSVTPQERAAQRLRQRKKDIAAKEEAARASHQAKLRAECALKNAERELADSSKSSTSRTRSPSLPKRVPESKEAKAAQRAAAQRLKKAKMDRAAKQEATRTARQAQMQEEHAAKMRAQEKEAEQRAILRTGSKKTHKEGGSTKEESGKANARQRNREAAKNSNIGRYMSTRNK